MYRPHPALLSLSDCSTRQSARIFAPSSEEGDPGVQAFHSQSWDLNPGLTLASRDVCS